MTIQEAQAVAEQLGDIQLTPEKLQAEIGRLNRKTVVTLSHVEALHNWLEGSVKQSNHVAW